MASEVLSESTEKEEKKRYIVLRIVAYERPLFQSTDLKLDSSYLVYDDKNQFEYYLQWDYNLQ